MSISAGSQGAMKLIYTKTLTATATLLGVDYAFDENKNYLVIIRAPVGATPFDISLYGNSDTTATNYYTQLVDMNHNTLTGARSNNAIIATNSANDECYITCYIQHGYDTRLRCQCQSTFENAAAIKLRYSSMVSVTQFATLATITFSSSAANGWQIGTKINVYELG